MSIQIEQLIILTCYSLMGVAFYYIKIKSVRIALVVLGLILFAVNPVRFKQEGGAALERGTAQFEDIPERIVVEQTDFNAHQQQELDKLNQATKDIQHEIHD